MGNRKRTDLLVVHVTATPVDFGMTSAKLRAMHKRRGFSDIGYNEWIDRNAKLHKGRGVDEVGAHVAGYNSRSYGISLEGGHKKADATPAMMVTLEKRLRELVKKYPNAKICGHRDLSPDGDGDGVIEPHEHTKQCPWFDAIPWAKSKGLPGADIKGVWKTMGGTKGPDARDRWLQKLLRAKGYLVVADGIIGPNTKAQIEQFQTDVNIQVTGKFDKATVIKLRAPAAKGVAKKDIAAAGGAVAVPVIVTVVEPSYLPYVMLSIAAVAGVVIAWLILRRKKHA